MVQARATQLDFFEIGTGEIRVIQQGAAQVCSAEVSLIKPRMYKISTRHVGSFKISG